MKEETLLRDLISEIVAPLGLHAFSDERQILPSPPPSEKNTAAETRLFQKIIKSVERNAKLDVRAAETIKGILRDGQYQDMLREPEAEMLYRGMILSPKEIEALLGTKDWIQAHRGGLAGDFVFRPRGGAASSWTTDKSVASNFTGTSWLSPRGDRNKRKVVMTARRSSNPFCFFELKPFYPLLSNYDFYSAESEAVGLGDIKFEFVEMGH
jgi:hypothetical protein